MKSRWATFIVCLLGFGMIAWATGGLRAFTTEGARRLSLVAAPRALPDVPLYAMDGSSLRLHDLKGRILVADFIYTRCPWVCYAMGSSLEQVRDRLAALGLNDRVTILSISFDPNEDDAEALRHYGDRFRADGQLWQVATVPDPTALAALLESAGVTVVRSPDGGFEHNAAIHVIDYEGRLVQILDFDNVGEVMKTVEDLL